MAAARTVACEAGVAGASTRKIAAAAGVNQALVFYHFAGVHELIAAASNHFVDEALARHSEEFARAATTADLLEIAEALRRGEGQKGNVAFMAQVLAAASIPVIGGAAAYALDAWTREIARTLERITAGTVAAELVDIEGLAPLITAAFVGLELYSGASPRGGVAAAETLASLTGMVDSLLAAGPVARAAMTQVAKHAKRR